MDESEFNKAKKEFLDWNKKLLSETIITPDVAPTGQARIGQTVWTRFTPSASFIGENYQDVIEFILSNPIVDDLLEDDDLIQLHNILKDYVFLMDQHLNEGAKYASKTDSITKIKNRKRYKRDRNKILARIKRQKKTVQGIAMAKKRERLKNTNLRAKDMKQKKKYNIKSKGQHRTVK